MFDKQIRLYGKHADIIRKYSKDKQGADEMHFEVTDENGNKKNIYIFDSILQCYMVAAMAGIISKRKAPVDSDHTKTANIFADILYKKRDLLTRIYQHMVLTESSSSIDGKIKKAFSINKENEDQEQTELENYVRGGLEIIDDYFSECKSYEDVSYALLQFVQEYGTLDEE